MCHLKVTKGEQILKTLNKAGREKGKPQKNYYSPYMKQFFAKFLDLIIKFFNNFPVSATDAQSKNLPSSQSAPLSPEESRKLFRSALTEYVADGWSIEIENELEAVLSRKSGFRWVGKMIIFLILLLVFAPLAFFYLIVVIVKGVTAKPNRIRIRVDENGFIQNS